MMNLFLMILLESLSFLFYICIYCEYKVMFLVICVFRFMCGFFNCEVYEVVFVNVVLVVWCFGLWCVCLGDVVVYFIGCLVRCLCCFECVEVNSVLIVCMFYMVLLSVVVLGCLCCIVCENVLVCSWYWLVMGSIVLMWLLLLSELLLLI